MPVDNWGTVNLGPSSPEGKPYTVGNGVDGYSSGWIRGGNCYPSP